MLRKIPWPWVGLYATLALFGAASYFKWYSMWGINHLAFLPSGWWVVYWLAVAAVTALALMRDPTPRLDRLLAAIAKFVFDRGIWPRVWIAAGFTLLFIGFRTEVQLLGDGYTWLAIFGNEGYYISKWAEQGGIWLLRAIQWGLGGYTMKTALLAFQITSICSGAAYVYLSILSIRELVESPRARLLGLVLLCGSGVTLLFFGYAEFYPPLWPLAILYVIAVKRGLTDSRWAFASALILAIGTLLHAQMIILSPGLVFLMVHRVHSLNVKVQFRATLLILCLLGTVGLWLVMRNPETAIMLLPYFTGRSIAPDYAVFSLVHIADIFELTMIVCPLVFSLLMSTRLFSTRHFDSTSAVLVLMSFGSITFLVLYGAAITMARDWDVMAFGLLAPVLLLIHANRFPDNELPSRLLLATGLIGVLLTVSYVATCTTVPAAESRFYSILNERTRSGYVVLSNYYAAKGDAPKAREIAVAMSDRFPDYKLLAQAYARLDRKDIDGAFEIAQRLMRKDSTQPDFLQIMGNLFGKRGYFDSANFCYDRAQRYNPYSNVILNEYGQLLMAEQLHDSALVVLKRANSLPPARSFVRESLALAYIHLNRYPDALAVADTLFASALNSPGGHLIYMIVNLRKGYMAEARRHYECYLVSGKARSDYEGIRERYQYLIGESR